MKLRYLAGLSRHTSFGNGQFNQVIDRTTCHGSLFQAYTFAMHFRTSPCDVTDFASAWGTSLSLGLILTDTIKWAPSSEFVSSRIPSWQILTAHAQPFRGARDLAFCLKVPLDSLLVWASSEGSGETAQMRRLAWTYAARIGDNYQIRLTRSKCQSKQWVRECLCVLFETQWTHWSDRYFDIFYQRLNKVLLPKLSNLSQKIEWSRWLIRTFTKCRCSGW